MYLSCLLFRADGLRTRFNVTTLLMFGHVRGPDKGLTSPFVMVEDRAALDLTPLELSFVLLDGICNGELSGREAHFQQITREVRLSAAKNIVLLRKLCFFVRGTFKPSRLPGGFLWFVSGPASTTVIGNLL